MTVNELKNRLKSGNVAGWYLFCGEEAFLRRHYLGELRRAVLTDPATDTFNHILLEGGKIDWGALESALEAPPMFADRKLVEWHLLDFNAMRESDLTILRETAEQYKGADDTVTVFVADADCFDAGTERRPSKLYKTLSGIMELVEFQRSDEASLRSWLARHFQHNGIEGDLTVLNALLERSGRSMDTLAGEVEKLSAFVKANGRTRLTEEDVAFVASPHGESEAFGLDNALLDGRPDGAYAALREARLLRTEPVILLGTVTRVLCDLYAIAAMAAEGMRCEEIAAAMPDKKTKKPKNEYVVRRYMRAAARRTLPDLREALALCRETDAALKGNTGIDAYLTLELLLSKVIK